jgi:hypothetical protein
LSFEILAPWKDYLQWLIEDISLVRNQDDHYPSFWIIGSLRKWLVWSFFLITQMIRDINVIYAKLNGINWCAQSSQISSSAIKCKSGIGNINTYGNWYIQVSEKPWRLLDLARSLELLSPPRLPGISGLWSSSFPDQLSVFRMPLYLLYHST